MRAKLSATDRDILLLCQREGGSSVHDLGAENYNVAWAAYQRLLADGMIVRLRLSHRNVRYFVTEDQAAAFKSARVDPVRASASCSLIDPDAVAIYPTNPDGSPSWKFTKCHSVDSPHPRYARRSGDTYAGIIDGITS